MKRCIEWISSWFVQWVEKMSPEKKIGSFLGAVTGLIIGIMVFGTLNTTPATAMDYKLLGEQMVAVQQSPLLLFQMNCDVETRDEMITVSMSNDKCWIIAKYDKDFEILSFSKGDTAVVLPPILAVIVAVIAGVAFYVLFAPCYVAVIYKVENMWKFIRNKFCKDKK